MSIHRWHTDDTRPGAPRLSFGRRWFISWGPEDGRRHDAHLDVYLNRPVGHGWGFQLRFDGPHAETPIDAAVFLGRWAYAFTGTSRGSRLCKMLRVTGAAAENHWQGGSREIAFRYSGNLDGAPARRFGQASLIKWHLWSDPEHSVFGAWNRKEMRKTHSRAYVWFYETFRRGYHHPIGAIFDRLFGKTAYVKEELATTQAVATLPEGDYPLNLTLERATWKRPRALRPALTRTTAEYEVLGTRDGGPGYAPTGRVKYGSDDGLVASSTRNLTAYEAATPDKWVPIAIASFTEHVLLDRARYQRLGWAPEHPTGVEVTV